MAAPFSAARRWMGGASPPAASADQSSSQTWNGFPSAPASPRAPRLQRSNERKCLPWTSVTVKWARYACRDAHSDVRGGMVGASAERKNVS